MKQKMKQWEKDKILIISYGSQWGGEGAGSRLIIVQGRVGRGEGNATLVCHWLAMGIGAASQSDYSSQVGSRRSGCAQQQTPDPSDCRARVGDEGGERDYSPLQLLPS